jgi:prepilin-type N-terminal cleavage/methylation domain-containing protein
MNNNSQDGFSVLELLLVITIIGIIAALGIPSYQKGKRAVDNGTIYASLRSVASTQVGFFSQNQRFARLSELNALHGNGLGTPVGTSLIRGRFVIEMSPVTPTDTELKTAYTILATGPTLTGEPTYIFRLTQSGEIVQISP